VKRKWIRLQKRIKCTRCGNFRGVGTYEPVKSKHGYETLRKVSTSSTRLGLTMKTGGIKANKFICKECSIKELKNKYGENWKRFK